MAELALAAALAQVNLPAPDGAIPRLAQYWEVLEQWRDAVNLTGCRTVEEFVDTLVLGALAPLIAGLRSPSEGPVFDVGSGSGNPGLVLACFWPTVEVRMIESNTRKASFIRHAVTLLKLGNAGVVTARAESVGHDPDQRESAPLAVSRAAAPPARACELGLPLVRPGGRLWLYLSPGDAKRVEGHAGLLGPLGASRVLVHSAALPAGVSAIAEIRKEAPSDQDYPRPESRAAREPIF